MQLGRQGRTGGHAMDAEPAGDVLRRVGDEVQIPAQDHLGLVNGPDDRAAIDRADGPGPEQEGGDDAEVAAAAAHGPEEIGVLVLAGGHEPPVGQNHLDGQQVINRQAIGARQIAQPAAQRQAADAGGGDDAAGHGQAIGVCCLIDLAPGAAAPYAHGARRGIDVDGLHGREVNNQPIVHHRQAGAVMAAAANGHVQLVVAGKGHGRGHVGGVSAAGDQRRVLVDHGVIDGAGLIVTRVGGGDHFALQPGRKTADGFPVQCRNCSLHHGSSVSYTVHLAQPVTIPPTGTIMLPSLNSVGGAAGAVMSRMSSVVVGFWGVAWDRWPRALIPYPGV